jgi:hypothetical protein
MKRRIVTILAALALAAASSIAYEKELDEQKIHEAYVLGQRNDKSTGDFLATYAAQITEPQNGPHIAQIELLTPYAQIVDLCRRKAADGYAESQAVQDYKSRGKSVKLHVLIMLPAAYPKAEESTAAPTPPPATGTQKREMTPEDFWQNFQFHLKQNGKSIASRSISNLPVHSTATSNAAAILDGENVWLEFDAKDVASDLTVVEVVTPEGKTIKASFDLKKLR